MASAYKWQVSNGRYAYLVGANKNHEYTEGSLDEYCFISSAIVDEDGISLIVKNLSEEEYSDKYDALKTLLASDTEGQRLNMLSYRYFYNTDDSSCNVVKDTSSIRGAVGTTGVGIDGITYKYDNTNNTTIVTVHLTDNTTYPIVIKNGTNGTDGKDGKDGVSGVTTTHVVYDFDKQDEIMNEIYSSVLTSVRSDLTELKNNLQNQLDNANSAISGLSGDVASVYKNFDDSTASYNIILQYYNGLSSSITELQEYYDGINGRLQTSIDNVETLSGTVTQYKEDIDVSSGQYDESFSRYDSVSDQLNSWNEKFDALKNEYDNTVATLTGDGAVSLSQICQTADSLKLIVENSNGIAAGIVASINNDNSDIKIKADRIYLLGETIVKELNAIDLSINGGKSKFNQDGSGYVANGAILWNNDGSGYIGGKSGITWNTNGDINFGKEINVKIDGDLSAMDVTLGNGTSYFDKSGSGFVANKGIIWNADGSGSIGNGAISWDAAHKVTFSDDVVLSSDQITIDADTVIGILNENAINGGASRFNKDGSGYLANENISWDSKGSLKVKGDITVSTMRYVSKDPDSWGAKTVLNDAFAIAWLGGAYEFVLPALDSGEFRTIKLVIPLVSRAGGSVTLIPQNSDVRLIKNANNITKTFTSLNLSEDTDFSAKGYFELLGYCSNNNTYWHVCALSE
jgi:hypothetical protein